MLAVIEPFGEALPPACQTSCQEAWAILDVLLSKFGNLNDVAERTTRVLRAGIRFFGQAVQPVVTSVLARMSLAFEATGFASYVWIAGKTIAIYSEEESQDMYAAVREVYERSTSKVVSLLQQKQLSEIPDGMLSCETDISKF